jgi:hypothetical protein
MPDYTEQFWVNGPDGQTPLDAARLNHMEDGIAAASIDQLIVLAVGQTVPVGTPPGTVVVQKLA